MGQKVHPKSFRLGVIKNWSSRWFVQKDYAEILHRDLTLRRAIRERLKNSGIGEIEIERQSDNVKVNIFTSKPGMVIGRQGAALEELRQDLSHQFGEKIELNVLEVNKPECEAQLIADSIAEQISRRMPFRRVIKQAVARGKEGGLLGVKVRVAGRLNGADIAREESFKQGNIPLHTLRSNVDFGQAVARTTYGAIGIKVWTCQGEVFARDEQGQKRAADKAWLAESRQGPERSGKAGRLEEELSKR